MKKFLTVLLVIAVMFTFSFSSAFATIDQQEMELNNAKAEALSTIGSYAVLANYSTEQQAEILYVLNDAKTLLGSGTTAVDKLLKASTAAELKVAYKYADVLWYTGTLTSSYATVTDVDATYGVYDVLNAYTKYVDGLTKKTATLAEAQAAAVAEVEAYADLSLYTTSGQAQILETLASTVFAIKYVDDTIYEVNSSVAYYKDFVDYTMRTEKVNDVTAAWKKYEAQYEAYLGVLVAITGNLSDYKSTMEVAAKVTTVASTTDAQVSYKNVEEVKAVFDKAVAAANKVANAWQGPTNTKDEKTTTTLATKATKLALQQAIKNYAVANGTTVALLLDLNAEYDKAVAEIEAAVTEADLDAIEQKYIGAYAAAQYEYATTTGVYLGTAKAKGIMPTLVANASVDGSGTVEYKAAWTELSEYVAAHYVASEVALGNWTAMNSFLALVDQGAAGKATSTTLFTSNSAKVLVENGIAYFKSLTRAYTEASSTDYAAVDADTFDNNSETTPTSFAAFASLTNAAADAAKTFNVGNYVTADKAAALSAKLTYDLAIAEATTVAEVRAAQKAFYDALEALTTTTADLKAKAKAAAKVALDAALKTAKGTKKYSADVQAAMDYLYADVVAFIDKSTATQSDLINYANEDAYELLIKLAEVQYNATGAVNYLLNDTTTFTSVVTLTDLKLGTDTTVNATTTNLPLTAFNLYLKNKLEKTYNVDRDVTTPTIIVASNFDKTGVSTAYQYDNDMAIVKSIVEAYESTTYGSAQGEIAQYKAVADQLAAYKTALVAQFAEDYAKFEAAMAKLGTPDKTANTLSLYKAAKSAWDTMYDYYADTTNKKMFSADQKAAYEAAKFTLVDYWYGYRLAGQTAGWTTYFSKDALDGTTEGKLGAWTVFNTNRLDYSTTDRTKAEAAYNVAIAKYNATKDSAVAKAAVDEAIAVITSLVPTNAAQAAKDLAANLALAKLYAQNYFAKYESKVFTSAATTYEQLRDEVVAGVAKSVIADKKVTTKKVANGIQVTCEAVAGATKYNFYRATSLNGTYKLMLTKTTNTYTNTAVKKGMKYYYKVTVVVNGVESELSTHTGVRTW